MGRQIVVKALLASILIFQTMSLVTSSDAPAKENDAEELLGSTTTADLVDLICSCRENEMEIANRHRDCFEIMKAGASKSGIYTIYPSVTGAKDNPVVVWCDLETNGGGWTVLQKRYDGSVNFDREWEDYKNGFGFVGGEFWLGNKNIHVITNQREYEVQLEVDEYDGTTHLERYNNFRLTAESDHYRLLTGTYTGKQDVCITPLGMESGDIPDSWITASSEHSSAIYKAPKARLDSTAGSWYPATRNADQWIMVNLQVPHIISGVIVQGRHDSGNWVKTYKVDYHDGFVWRYIMDSATGDQKVFAGSTNQNGKVYTYYDFPIKARYFRIRPQTWQGHPSMRFELLGCEGTFLAFENNRPFSTKDVDNDADGARHCAATRSAWWYGKSCTESDLNYDYMTGAGPTNRGIVWRDFEQAQYSIKRTEMKIRPVDHDLEN